MIWILGGYMWLFVHRPFEVWPSLGALQIERGYMLLMILAWLVYPGKSLRLNRHHFALALFSLALVTAWGLSPYADESGCTEVVENFAKVTVFYVLVITTVRDEKSLRLLIFLFLTAVALYMAHRCSSSCAAGISGAMGTRRMIGVDITFSDPNAFASTLLYTVPLMLPFWLERPRRIPTLLFVGYLLAIACCILLTGSRPASSAWGCWPSSSSSAPPAARPRRDAVRLAGLVGFVVLCVALRRTCRTAT